MEIDVEHDVEQETWEKAKKNLGEETDIHALIGKSLRLGAKKDECQNFDFDIKVLSISGKFCKSLYLSYKVKFAGITIVTDTLDLKKGSRTIKFNSGVESITVTFYAKGTCLYIKGKISGWFHKDVKWDTKILCV